LKRILYFSREYTTHDFRFLSALGETNNKIYYLRLENQGQPFEDRALPVTIQMVPWIGGRARFSWKDSIRFIKDLRRVLQQIKPDLVLAGPIQRSAFLVALAGFSPLISMSWGYDLLHDVRRNKLWELATRFTLKRSDAMVGDCDTIRGIAVQYGMDPKRIVIFPWGIDIHHFAVSRNEDPNPIRNRKGWDENKFVLLSTRTWASLYGVVDLARAFILAFQQRSQLRLLMLGGGPQSQQIKRIFTQSGLIDYVHFPGQVNQAELVHYYQAADLYISTSHSDGTSISLLEALACGCPVLLSDIPGNREWINPGEQGWLYPDGDVAALAKAIVYAVDNRSKLTQMGESARKLVEQRGDWENNFPKLFDAFNIALGNADFTKQEG